MEYPIVNEKGINSVTRTWKYNLSELRLPETFVPTYENCASVGLYPRIVDVVISYNGKPVCFIEICNTNPTEREKINELRRLGLPNLIEIDAKYILQQTKIPSKLLELKPRILIKKNNY